MGERVDQGPRQWLGLGKFSFGQCVLLCQWYEYSTINTSWQVLAIFYILVDKKDLFPLFLGREGMLQSFCYLCKYIKTLMDICFTCRNCMRSVSRNQMCLKCHTNWRTGKEKLILLMRFLVEYSLIACLALSCI